MHHCVVKVPFIDYSQENQSLHRQKRIELSSSKIRMDRLVNSRLVVGLAEFPTEIIASLTWEHPVVAIPIIKTNNNKRFVLAHHNRIRA